MLTPILTLIQSHTYLTKLDKWLRRLLSSRAKLLKILTHSKIWMNLWLILIKTLSLKCWLKIHLPRIFSKLMLHSLPLLPQLRLILPLMPHQRFGFNQLQLATKTLRSKVLTIWLPSSITSMSSFNITSKTSKLRLRKRLFNNN